MINPKAHGLSADHECSVLLACDDELAALELRQALNDEIILARSTTSPVIPTMHLRFEQVILAESWEISLSERAYDLCIFALAGDSPAQVVASNPFLHAKFPRILFIVDSPAAFASSEHIRRPSDRILMRPFTDSTLRMQVEQMLFKARSVRPAAIEEERYLAFLRQLSHQRVRAVSPVYDQQYSGGVFYPQIADAFGFAVDEVDVLSHLTTLGFFRRVIDNRLRICPSCDSHRLVYREVCARCGSLDFSRSTMVHHFACGHMDVAAAFERNGELHCPKCTAALKHIGVDHDRPAAQCKCAACGFIAAETAAQAHCWQCKKVCAPDQTKERLVYAYELTPMVEQAVAANAFSPTALSSVFRDGRSGLYARNFFLYELNREHLRHRRYDSPGTVLMLRIARCTALDKIAAQVAGRMRTLDLACLWSANMIAILLPETTAAGGEVVAKRLHALVTEADGAATGHVAIGLASFAKEFAEAQDVVRAALASIDEEESQENYVLLD
jgi:GGDEF domain-containing protein